MRYLVLIALIINLALVGCSETKMENSPEERVYVKSRYGNFTDVTSDEELKTAVSDAIQGLGEEEFSSPDIEHATVDLGHPNGWEIMTHLDGFVRLDHETGNGETEHLYLQNIPPQQLEQIYLQIGRGQIEEVLKLDWKKSADELEPYARLYYLYSSRPDLNDLHRAASADNVKWAKEAIEEGADLNGKSKHGETPLHYAVLAENIKMCQFLIEAGADVNARDGEGQSVLRYTGHDIAEFDDLADEIRDLLIKHGAKE